MCFILTSNQQEPFIAHRDMICYKVLYNANCDDQLYSPFRVILYKLNQKYESVLDMPKVVWGGFIFNMVTSDRECVLNCFGINRGIHSYQRKYKSLFNYYSFLGIKNIHLYKCIIPKGAKYYKNQFGEYVSDSIIIKEEVEFK